MVTVGLQITGVGIILYSPWAAASIEQGADFLSSCYSNPDDVAAQVTSGAIIGVCTGSPGDYVLHIHNGKVDEEILQASDYKVRLCLEVRDQVFCVRDLYDLMSWDKRCPSEQIFSIPNGFYKITACTKIPDSEILGDHQSIHLFFESAATLPEVFWSGVPQLC